MTSNQFQLSRSRFQEIVSQIKSKPILVVGDVGIDRYTEGEATRLNPEAPVPIVSVEKIHSKLGLASNVANNLAAFSARPHLAGFIGKDRFADDLFGMLDECSINRDKIMQHEGRRTTVKERVIAMGQQVVRVDHEIRTPLTKEQEGALCAAIENGIEAMDALVIEDYAKGTITKSVAQELIRIAKGANKFVAVDPPSTSDCSRIEYYRGADMVTPNLREAEQLCGKELYAEDDILECGRALMRELECKILVITRGKDGMTIFSREEAPIHVPTFARQVFDVSGAGDTVIAMLTLAIAAGISVKEAATMANYAAGAGVGVPGTAVISVQELEVYMSQVNGFSD